MKNSRRPSAKNIRLLLALACLGLCLSASPVSVAAQESLTAASAAAFFDQVMPAQLEAYHIPGAVVAVVKDGQLLYTSGYGVDDLETGRPVSPERPSRLRPAPSSTCRSAGCPTFRRDCTRLGIPACGSWG